MIALLEEPNHRIINELRGRKANKAGPETTTIIFKNFLSVLEKHLAK